MKKTKIISTGIYTPKRVMTNNDWKQYIETSDEWIFERTGIKERRICSADGGEFPSDMAYNAAKDALNDAGLAPNDIDMILVASVTPDYKLPNTATVIQQKLGITNQCACLDISAACSGFVYGVNMADSMIKTGLCKRVLVCGTELLSQDIDWQDRKICILFGDGCGVAILEASDDNSDTSSQILATSFGADGSGGDFFSQKVGGAVQPITPQLIEDRKVFMEMKGKEMFKMATRSLASSAKKVISDAGMTIDDIDWIVPHQANIRIIKTTAKLLGVSLDKFIINIHKYGNTSAATIPLAFHEAIEEGKIKRGDIVLFDAFGAGLTYGATLLRF